MFGLEGGEGAAKGRKDEEDVDQALWGELESEEEEEESEEVCGVYHVSLKWKSCDQRRKRKKKKNLQNQRTFKLASSLQWRDWPHPVG